jgi:hypothetical protein
VERDGHVTFNHACWVQRRAFFALSLNEPGHNESWRIKTAWQPLQQNDLKGDKKLIQGV